MLAARPNVVFGYLTGVATDDAPGRAVSPGSAAF
jgi:hypothetical protein